MNVLEVIQQELANFYQFLYHVTPVFIFQVKSWSDSTFWGFAQWELFSTLLRDNPPFYLVINTKFSELSVDSMDNRQKFLNLEAFSFFFIELVKVLF